MSVELRERKWCGVLKIKKMDVEGCWMIYTIANGLRVARWIVCLQSSSCKLRLELVCYISYQTI